MVEGGKWLSVDPGHAPPDSRIRADGLSSGSGGVDHREILRVVGLWRRFEFCVHEGRPFGEHQPVLVHGCDRLFLLAVLRTHARTLAHPRGWDYYDPDRLLRVSARNIATAAILGSAHLHRYSPM